MFLENKVKKCLTQLCLQLKQLGQKITKKIQGFNVMQTHDVCKLLVQCPSSEIKTLQEDQS